jgi:hypothetical protein
VSSSRYSTFATASQLMPSSTSSSALARRAKRCAAEPSRVSSIRACRDALSRKPGRITRSAESRSHALASDSFGFPETRGIVRTFAGDSPAVTVAEESARAVEALTYSRIGYLKPASASYRPYREGSRFMGDARNAIEDERQGAW